MLRINHIKRASEALKALVKRRNESSDDIMTIGEIMDALHERGFGLIMLLFGLPLSVPLPVPPGYTTVLGAPLLMMSLQMVAGRRTPWLPAWLRKKQVKRSTLAKVIEKTSPMLMAIEKVMKPRLFGIIEGKASEFFYGLVCLLCSISIIIPLPLTNFIPAGGICLISLGLMSRDGLFAAIGVLLSAIGLVVTAAVLIFGASVVSKIFY